MKEIPMRKGKRQSSFPGSTPWRVVFFILILLFAIPLLGAGEYRRISQKADLSHASGKLGEYHALIIGINDYIDKKIPDLKTAVQDAQAVGEILKTRYGFHGITLLKNREASESAIDKAFRKKIRTLGPDDSLLVYYAGHGEIDRELGDGWWVPVDARGGDATTYIENTTVQKYLRAMKARHVLLVSDSCYSGTLFGESRALPGKIDDRFYLDLYNDRSRWGMTSGNKTPVSDRGFAGHSVFAYQFIRMLEKNKKPYLTPREIYVDIGPVIRNNSEQMPRCNPIKMTGDLGGEFVFILAGGAMQVETEIKPAKQKEQPRTGSLSVETTPPNAVIYIDGVKKGKAPRAFSRLTAGKVAVKAVMEGFFEEKEMVYIRPGRETRLTLLLDKVPTTGAVLVKSNPGGAKWWLDGAYVGVTPDKMEDVEKGPHRIKIKKQGYKEWNGSVEIVAGRSAKVRAELEVFEESGGEKAGDIWRDPVIGMEFVWVSGGCYQMGQAQAEKRSLIQEVGKENYDILYLLESPRHEVCVDQFWMGKYEVTVEQWKRFVSETGYAGEGENRWRCNGMADPEKITQEVNHPVACVSWEDATAFASWLARESGSSIKLPSEAQWEYGCRSGGKAEEYSGGDDLDEVAWYSSNSGGATHPVGAKTANGLYIYDMSGNVWEWCEDIYDKDAYNKHQRIDPIYTGDGMYRVVRGGYWKSLPSSTRCADRGYNSPDYRYDFIGFRLARTR